MKRLLACLFGFAVTSGATHAATYRYDLTMSLTSLTMPSLYGSGYGEPEIAIPGMEECAVYDDGFRFCEGTADFTHDRYGIDLLSIYEPVISGSLLIDLAYDPHDRNTTGQRPECTGSTVLCRHATNDTVYLLSASPAGFDIYTSDGIGYINEISSAGLYYEDDGAPSFTLGNMSYGSSGNGLIARYTTTSLDIAPVPLPAGALLLPFALALLRLTRRRAA